MRSSTFIVDAFLGKLSNREFAFVPSQNNQRSGSKNQPQDRWPKLARAILDHILSPRLLILQFWSLEYVWLCLIVKMIRKHVAHAVDSLLIFTSPSLPLSFPALLVPLLHFLFSSLLDPLVIKKRGAMSYSDVLVSHHEATPRIFTTQVPSTPIVFTNVYTRILKHAHDISYSRSLAPLMLHVAPTTDEPATIRHTDVSFARLHLSLFPNQPPHHALTHRVSVIRDSFITPRDETARALSALPPLRPSINDTSKPRLEKVRKRQQKRNTRAQTKIHDQAKDLWTPPTSFASSYTRRAKRPATRADSHCPSDESLYRVHYRPQSYPDISIQHLYTRARIALRDLFHNLPVNEMQRSLNRSGIWIHFVRRLQRNFYYVPLGGYIV